jgi:hypothetical protein
MQFFVLGDRRTEDLIYDADASRMKPTDVGEAPRCPACNEFVGMLPWLPPYHVEVVVHGSALGDVLKCSNTSLLVSDRFCRAWQDAGLRGIEEFSPLARLRVRPARLGRRPLSYYHIQPRHYGTQVDLEHSLIDYGVPVTCEKCKAGSLDSVRGFAIDESSWTGEDLFIPWGLNGKIVVTDRVRQLRDEHGLTNMNMTPVDEYLLDFYKRWTPIDYSRDDVAAPDEDADQDSASLN